MIGLLDMSLMKVRDAEVKRKQIACLNARDTPND
jgi:Mg2+/Co2+ transporter CorB